MKWLWVSKLLICRWDTRIALSTVPFAADWLLRLIEIWEVQYSRYSKACWWYLFSYLLSSRLNRRRIFVLSVLYVDGSTWCVDLFAVLALWVRTRKLRVSSILLFPGSLFVFLLTESIGPLRGLHVRFALGISQKKRLPWFHSFRSLSAQPRLWESRSISSRIRLSRVCWGEVMVGYSGNSRLIRPTVGFMRRKEKVWERK